MKTLQNKISPSGGDVSTSSVAGFHASRSLRPADAKEVEMTVTSGLRCLEQYGRLSPLSSLARTFLASSAWLSPVKGLRWKAKPLCSTREIDVIERSSSSQSSASVKTLKKRDTMSNRLLFQLVPLARLTEGTGFGLSRNGEASDLMKTPSAMDCNVTAKAHPVPGTSGTCAQEILSGYCKVSLLPTPMAVEVTHSGRSVSPWGRTIAKDGTTYAPSLTDVVNRLLPTPQALDCKISERKPTFKNHDWDDSTLTDFAYKTREKTKEYYWGAGLLATPIGTDFRGPHIRPTKIEKGKITTVDGTMMRLSDEMQYMAYPNAKSTADPHGKPSQLNPLFWEEMMGYPLEWTLLPFLTASSEQRR